MRSVWSVISLTEICWPIPSLWMLYCDPSSCAPTGPPSSWLPAFSPCPHSAFTCMSESPPNAAQAVSTVGQRHDCESAWVNSNSLSDTGTAGSHACPHQSAETVKPPLAQAPPRADMRLPSLPRSSGDSPTRLCPSDVLMGMNGAEGGVPCLLAPVSRADGQGKVGEGPSRAVNQLTDKCEWARPLASPGQMGSCLIGEWMGVPLA